MLEKKWYTFIETNDWEGETWKFFVQLTEEEFNHLTTLIKDNESYELIDDSITEIEIDTLVKHGGSGYMDFFNKVKETTKPVLEVTIEDIDSEESDDIFYKGNFWIYR